MKNISVIGMGYVGFSNAILLAQKNNVTAIDINKEKIELINKMQTPFLDKQMQDFLQSHKLNLNGVPVSESQKAFLQSDYIIIATPTDYNEETNFFDTSSIETVLSQIIESGTKATVVIKSTIPIGFIENYIKEHNFQNLLFSPEFLKEGSALYDNLYPSRIIVSYSKTTPQMKQKASEFASLLQESSAKKDVPVLICYSSEAEAVKLFSNTYLAMRVAFFNELDSFTLSHNLDSAQIIKGISLDSRIGDFYNNPSFGYGGYCLPKDTKQLLANFDQIPQNLIKATIESNKTRKNFIIQQILSQKPKTVGIYRLTMKSNSDNFRQSSIHDIINGLKQKNIKIIIYEPSIKSADFQGFSVINNLDLFAKSCDMIIANRMSKELQQIKTPVFTRDLYQRD
ncbi:MAG: nucleotide sugar dehydrogenase [Treponema sp.]|nr:nucleotide sugar dehydrogenase [Treponema sp.]